MAENLQKVMSDVKHFIYQRRSTKIIQFKEETIDKSNSSSSCSFNSQNRMKMKRR